MPFTQSGCNPSVEFNGPYNDVSGDQYNGDVFATASSLSTSGKTKTKVKVAEDPSKTNTTCTGSLKEGKHINDDEEKGESSTTNDEGKGEAVSTNSEGKKEIGSTVPSSNPK
ncbi:hypothetical protein PNOK_0969300 [Pyrrhoderma noxium]|uniref:Uncharacterized protein n=1 Tax=Pyrrhoderma noxium TaxID=2282107 RepID=A0A286U4W4_9AGAM|nr:hypothetical protein PNOK_0969300 [Pyrrhoderma noxium]